MAGDGPRPGHSRDGDLALYPAYSFRRAANATHDGPGIRTRRNAVAAELRLRGSSQQRPGMETTMRGLLVLLVALTMACGAAAGLTVSLAPFYAEDAGKGY